MQAPLCFFVKLFNAVIVVVLVFSDAVDMEPSSGRL